MTIIHINNALHQVSTKVDSAQTITIRTIINLTRYREQIETDNTHYRKIQHIQMEIILTMFTKISNSQNHHTCRLDNCIKVIAKSKPNPKKDPFYVKPKLIRGNLLHLIWWVNKCNNSQLISIIHKRCNKAVSIVKFTHLNSVIINPDNLPNQSLMMTHLTQLTQTIKIVIFKT